MKKKSLLNWLLVITFLSGITGTGCTPAPIPEKTTKSIVIEAEITKYFYRSVTEIFYIRDAMRICYVPYGYISSDPPLEYVFSRVRDGKVTWILNTDKPIKVIPPFGHPIFMKPGDSLHIKYHADIPAYSGKNGESLALLNTLMGLEERLVKPRTRYSYKARSLEYFLEWNAYLDHQLELKIPVIESYKNKISSAEYDYYKGNIIGQIEDDRVSAFSALSDSVHKGYPGLSYIDLTTIWDSTQNKPYRQWLQSLPAYYGPIYDYYSYLRMKTGRKFSFTPNDSLKSKEYYAYLLYTSAKQEYKDLVRERLMAYILDEQTITEMGLKNPMTQTMLKDYYSQPGYTEYKKYVKSIEEKEREKEL
jgi:hypothetical protein